MGSHQGFGGMHAQAMRLGNGRCKKIWNFNNAQTRDHAPSLMRVCCGDRPSPAIAIFGGTPRLAFDCFQARAQ
jgi:hypothetical protein